MAELGDEGRVGPNREVDISLRKLCWWMADGQRGTFEYLREHMAPNFWHSETNDSIQLNPNGSVLTEFMRNYRHTVDLEDTFALPSLPARPTRSILLVSYYAPSLAHAGGLRILDVYAEIKQRHPDVRLTLFAGRNEAVDGDVTVLDDIFDAVHFCELHEFKPEMLEAKVDLTQGFDVMDLQFHQAALFAKPGRRWARRILFTPMEVLSRFDFDIVAKAAGRGSINEGKFFSLVHNGVNECRAMHDVDLTVCVSDADAGFLARIAGEARVNYFPTGLSRAEFKRELDPDYVPPPVVGKHNRLVFAAYFGSETNVMGLEWYLEKVHGQVLAAVPDYDLAVVGRGDTERLQRLRIPAVKFIGEVPILSPVLEQAKAGLVLAINGSGFRGKINQYSVCGLPTISTRLGATGLEYQPGTEILLADDPDRFARVCIDLLTNDDLAQRLAKAARQRALSTYTWQAVWQRVAAIYGLPDRTPANG